MREVGREERLPELLVKMDLLCILGGVNKK